MISTFSFDQEFFKSKALNDESLSAAHDFITNAWLEAGVLILPQGGIDQLLELIKTLPAKFHQRWKEAIEYGKIKEINQDWWEFSQYPDFAKTTELHSFFKTAFSEETVGFTFGKEQNYKNFCEKTKFELLAAGVCSESVHIANSIRLCELEIHNNQTPEEVWNSRFEALAQHSKKITIIDRYFFQNIKESNEKNQTNESLKNFFSFLSRTNKNFNIRIISHGGERESDFHRCIFDTFYRKVMRIPALSKSIANLTLISSTENFFKTNSHDRFVCFDRHVCQIGNGMRVLGNTPIPQSTFSAKFDRHGEAATREAMASRPENRLWQETL